MSVTLMLICCALENLRFTFRSFRSLKHSWAFKLQELQPIHTVPQINQLEQNGASEQSSNELTLSDCTFSQKHEVWNSFIFNCRTWIVSSVILYAECREPYVTKSVTFSSKSPSTNYHPISHYILFHPSILQLSMFVSLDGSVLESFEETIAVNRSH